MNQEKTGKFIAASRKNKNLTQEQLAEILGVNNRTISRWENGKNMPDISLLKLICKTLDISIEELINGERTTKNNLTTSYEKAIISTISTNNKINKKMNKLIKIFLSIIIIILSITISIIIYYKNKYPKIDIYNLNTINSEENKLNKSLTLNQGKYKIYFYGIESLQIGDVKNNYYDLKNALRYNQTTIKDIKNYLEQQYNNEFIERYILWDGGTKIYRHKKYEVILCNTLDGNKDIYFGTPNIQDNLKGAYCGKKEIDTCYFTRTYYIMNIAEDNDAEFINVTLKQFQEEPTIVKINKSNNIQVGNTYEFTFSTYETFNDNINEIFENSSLIKTTLTAKIGLEQTNEKICVNN